MSFSRHPSIVRTNFFSCQSQLKYSRHKKQSPYYKRIVLMQLTMEKIPIRWNIDFWEYLFSSCQKILYSYHLTQFIIRPKFSLLFFLLFLEGCSLRESRVHPAFTPSGLQLIAWSQKAFPTSSNICLTELSLPLGAWSIPKEKCNERGPRIFLNGHSCICPLHTIKWHHTKYDKVGSRIN